MEDVTDYGGHVHNITRVRAVQVAPDQAEPLRGLDQPLFGQAFCNRANVLRNFATLGAATAMQ